MNSIQKTARIAGGLYLLLIPLGVFGIIYVPEALFVSGDIAATINNIKNSEMLFRLAIASALLVQLVQILLVLYLYKLLKSVNKNHAVLMVVFALAAVPIAMLNELNFFGVLLVLNGAEQSHALVSLFLGLHEHGILIAQIFWGLWLLPMGYLVYKSGFLPRIIGVLLVIGCVGYLADSFAFFVFPNFGLSLSEFTFIGEIVLPLWLVFKGVNMEEWERRAVESV